MYAVLVVLALFVLASYVLLEHGGGSIAAPRDGSLVQLSLHDLTLEAPAYDGEEIRTSGTLGFNDEQGRYELFEAPGGANYTVPIQNYDTNVLQRFDGRIVTVRGIFIYDPDTGFYIEPISVEPGENVR